MGRVFNLFDEIQIFPYMKGSFANYVTQNNDFFDTPSSISQIFKLSQNHRLPPSPPEDDVICE